MISAWYIIPILLGGISLGVSLSGLIECWGIRSEKKLKKNSKKDRNKNRNERNP